MSGEVEEKMAPIDAAASKMTRQSILLGRTAARDTRQPINEPELE